MDIKRVELSELAVLRDFAERTFRIAYETDNEPETFHTYCREAFTNEKFREEMEHPFSSFWFGYVDGQLAAYLKLNSDNTHEALLPAKTMQVERIYVEPVLQGQKLGVKLLDFSMQQAKDAGAEWLWLSVWQENPRAVKFYERYGLEIFGTDIFYLADDPQTDWAMRKRIV